MALLASHRWRVHQRTRLESLHLLRDDLCDEEHLCHEGHASSSTIKRVHDTRKLMVTKTYNPFGGMREEDKKSACLRLVQETQDIMDLTTGHARICPYLSARCDASSTTCSLVVEMDFAAGRSLWDAMEACRDAGQANYAITPRPDLVNKTLASCVEALAHCHSSGLVHRDVKPQNVLLMHPAGSSIEALALTSNTAMGLLCDIVLSDFAIPSLENGALKLSIPSAQSIAKRDRSWNAPELLTKEGRERSDASPESSAAADMWSLGAVLFCLATGVMIGRQSNRNALKGKTWKLTDEIRSLESDGASLVGWESIAGPVKSIICACLSLEPSERPTSSSILTSSGFVSEFKSALASSSDAIRLLRDQILTASVDLSREQKIRSEVEKRLPEAPKDTGLRLREAAKNGRVDEVREVLKQFRGNSAVLDEADSKGRTAATYAASRGHEVCLRMLLSNGASCNRPTKGGGTPVIFAVSHGFVDCLRVLLEHQQSNGTLDINAPVNQRRQWTLLHYAAYNNTSSCIALLLAQGAKCDSLDASGRCPLDWVMQKPSQSNAAQTASKRMLQAAAAAAAGGGGEAAAISSSLSSLSLSPSTLGQAKNAVAAAGIKGEGGAAAAERELKALREFMLSTRNVLQQERAIRDVLQRREKGLAAPASVGSALREVAKKGKLDELAVLLKRWKKNIVVDEGEQGHGWCPLHCAVREGHTDAVKMLIEQGGAFVDTQTNDGGTALIFASCNGFDKIVQLLLKAGAAVNHQHTHRKKWTSLHYAAHFGHQSCVALLIRAPGCDPTLLDDKGLSASEVASSTEIKRIFLKQKRTSLLAPPASSPSSPPPPAVASASAKTELPSSSSSPPPPPTRPSSSSLESKAPPPPPPPPPQNSAVSVLQPPPPPPPPPPPSSISSASSSASSSSSSSASTESAADCVDAAVEAAVAVAATFDESTPKKLQQQPRKPVTPFSICERLRDAASGGRTEEVKSIFRNHGNFSFIDEVDDHGRTALLLCAHRGNLETMKILLSEGAAVNIAASGTGLTACHWSAANGRDKCLSLLLANGGDKDAIDALGEVPLHKAMRENRQEVIYVLVRAGCSVDVRNAKGKTPSQVTRYEAARIALSQAVAERGWR